MARKFWLGRDDTLEFVKSDRSVIGTLDGDSGVLTVNDKALDGNLRTARVEYDFAVDGGAIGTITLRGQGALPAKAVILRGMVDVVTTVQTAGADAGTLALQAEAAGDLVAAIAVSDVSDPWDAGQHDIIPVGTAATAVKTTVARDLKLVIGGQAVTAGKLVLMVEYFLSA